MHFFSSAQNRKNVLRVIEIVAFLSILDRILKYNDKNMYIKTVLFILTFIFLVNEIIREYIFTKNRAFEYYFSYIISNIIIGCFMYKIECAGTEIYNVKLLIELIVFCGNKSVLMIMLNFIIYYIARGMGVGLFKISTFQNIAVNYFFQFLILDFFNSIIIEKTKTEKLNSQLESANMTLKKYAEKLKEFTVAQERTRIAQELHDSIGHSLTALSMNLEFAENVIDKKPEKAKEVIVKAHGIAKNCMADLRKAVSILKETDSSENFRMSINEIFRNFDGANKIRFILNMDEEAENIDIQIKDCIYKTVREAITNGVKHGSANVFTIDIFVENKCVNLHINNNGLECNNIVKSNGVIGIENRIYALSGTVSFGSEKGNGFTVDASIPL